MGVFCIVDCSFTKVPYLKSIEKLRINSHTGDFTIEKLSDKLVVKNTMPL